MSDTGSLICWSCNKRTPAGKCINCGALVSDPNTVFKDEDDVQEKESQLIIEIQRRDKENIRIDIKQVREIISNTFTLKRTLFKNPPVFIIENHGGNLNSKFKTLLEESENLTPGFKPIIEKLGGENEYKITFIYNNPPSVTDYKNVFILGIITIISILLAGMYNYNHLATAKNINLEGLVILETVFSLEVLLNGLLFTGILIGILIIKDIVQFYHIIRYQFSRIIPFYIPAPPFFEFGTIGSMNRQLKLHETRGSMFKDTFWGSLSGWVLSVIIITISLPMSVYNPEGASYFNEFSLVANGSYEPIGLGAIAYLTNTIGMTSFNLSAPITTQYVLNPITLAGLAGFYITGINLMPFSFFYGGYIFRSLTSKRVFQILTYIAIGVFLTLNWLFVALLYFMHISVDEPVILNEESPKPLLYQILIGLIIIIVVITFPIHVDILPYY